MAIFAHFCQHKIQQMFVATKNTLQISISSWSLSPFRHFSYIFSHWCMPLLTMWWAFTYLIDISWPSKFLWCLDLCVVKAYFFKQKFINYIFCILWFLLICIATEPLDLKVFSCWLHGWTLLQDDVTRCVSWYRWSKKKNFIWKTRKVGSQNRIIFLLYDMWHVTFSFSWPQKTYEGQ